jgi:hypothetical protein
MSFAISEADLRNRQSPTAALVRGLDGGSRSLFLRHATAEMSLTSGRDLD